MSDAQAISYHLSRLQASTDVLPGDHAAHKLIWRAYGLSPETEGATQPFRFVEVENPGDTDSVTYLVQSEGKPNWSGISGVDVQSKRIDTVLHTGDLLMFSLMGCLHRAVTGQSRKVALREDSEIEGWITQKARMHGFSIVSIQWTSSVLRAQLQRKPGVDRRFALPGVRFSGCLRITDPTAFAQALHSGIGPKAAFGFGMLSVARPT